MNRRHFLELLVAAPAAAVGISRDIPAYVGWDLSAGPGWVVFTVQRFRDDITQVCGVPIFDEEPAP